MKRLTAETIAAIQKDSKKPDTTFKALAEKYGVTSQTISYWAKLAPKKKKYKTKEKSVMTMEVPQAPTKPMICLIGQPEEVSKSLREMFS